MPDRYILVTHGKGGNLAFLEGLCMYIPRKQNEHWSGQVGYALGTHISRFVRCKNFK